METKNEIIRYKNELVRGSKSYKEVLKKFEASMPDKITNIEDYRIATDLLAFIGTKTKMIDTAYKYYYAPVQAKAKQIKADFAQYMDPLTELEVKVKERMKVFMLAEQERRDQEQAKIEREAMKNHKNEAMVSVPVVNDIKTQKGQYGSSTARTSIKWRVKDEKKIPKKYWVLDDIAIGKAVRAGEEIPGVETYKDINITKGRL